MICKIVRQTVVLQVRGLIQMVQRIWCGCAGVKYSVDVSRVGQQQFRLKLGSNTVDVVGRRLNDGGLLIQVYAAITNCWHFPQHLPKPSNTLPL